MKRSFVEGLSAFLIMVSLLSATPAAALAQNHGINIGAMDRSVDPGDDFFLYSNGTWFKTTEIPPDRSSLGIFQGIAAEVSKRNESLITEAANANTAEAKMVADYYAAFMDEQKIESRGLEPVKAELAEIAALKNGAALSSLLGSQMRADVDALNATNFYTDRLFGLWVSADFNNPKKNVPYILQGGLGLPDRDFYVGTDESNITLQGKYRTHIANVLKLANIADAEAKASRIYGLENKIAQVHATREDSSDVTKANNPWKTRDFAKNAPGIDWNAYFKAAGIANQPMIMVWHPGAIKGISALVKSEPLDVWKEYLTFHSLDRAS